MERSNLFALFERAADGVHIVAADQRIIFWNSAASRILGYEAKEVVTLLLRCSRGRRLSRESLLPP